MQCFSSEIEGSFIFFFFATVVVGGCKTRLLLLGQSNFFLVPEDGTPSYTTKTTGGENYNQLTQRIYERLSGNLSKVNFDFERKNSIGAKGYRCVWGNLAWSKRPPLSPPITNLHPHAPHAEIMILMRNVILTILFMSKKKRNDFIYKTKFLLVS